MRNFLGEVAQPIARPSLGEQPVRGVHQAVIDRLPLCKKNTEACELEEARQDAMNFGREASKQS